MKEQFWCIFCNLWSDHISENCPSHQQADADHCERLRSLNARFDIARTDDARNNIQQLIDSENLRWSLIQIGGTSSTSPQPRK
jgi:hypothetical protein